MTDKNIETPDQAGSPDQKLVNGGITDSVVEDWDFGIVVTSLC